MNPSAFALLWPIAPPVAIFMAFHFYLGSGEVVYAHGSSTYFLIVTMLWGAIALLWELFAVPLAIRALVREPARRSRMNLFAIAASGAYITAALWYGWYLWHAEI